MSIKRMSAGDGYRYLMRTVAVGDGVRDMSSSLTRYYTASGNPPGRWLGAGLAGLDDGRGPHAGSVATEEQMFRLFGMGSDPVTGEQLGNRPYRIGDHGRGSVAGFDLTFSAPKSVSVWWALADAGTQAEIVAAHHAALRACVELLEADVAATRVGANGVAQADVRGLIAAGFDHWDSRAGDPQLHTHLVVANRVQAADGRWRTLDSRALHRAVVAVSETYNALLADELSRRLGVTWEQRPRRHSATPAWEISGVPEPLMRAFSRRAEYIEAHKDELVRGFAASHGRQPSATEVLRLRQQATLATRPDKELRPLGELCAEWRQRAENVMGMDAGAWAKGIGADSRVQVLSRLSDEQQRSLGESVIAAVQEKRSTWSRWNVYAEATRQLMGIRFIIAADRLGATTAVVDAAVASSVLLTAPQLASTPAALRRRDGTSMFAHRHAEAYTSRALLNAEARLANAGRATGGPTVPEPVVEQTVAAPPPGHRYRLGPSQRAALAAIATSGRVLDVLVGPAGTGKTVTLAALRAAWETAHGPGAVLGLAPSAAAAEVLASELGIATENTAKWLTEHDREAGRLAEIDRCRLLAHRLAGRNPRAAAALAARIRELGAEVERWRLHPGQLLIIDEASLAGTVTLDRITAHAQAAAAKVLLVGDPAQLSAVDAGGAFAMLVHDRPDPAELTAIRRFTHRWERTASTQLRVGDPSAVAAYCRHGRVRGGDRDAMLDAAYQAWLADETAGGRALLVAGDSATVDALNARARNVLVARGAVDKRGVPIGRDAVAGIGDRVVTRRNDRTLTAGRGFVKNGDLWTVTAVHSDGSLTVQRAGSGPSVTLPAAYVAEHVELGYATTAYRAQGATVDTAHAVVDAATMTREALYVAMTRGRHSNAVYVVTDARHGDCHPHRPQPHTAAEVLTAVLRRTGADHSAHHVIRAEQDRVASIAQLADEYDTIAAEAQRPHLARLLATSGLTAEQVHLVEASPAYGALATALRRAEASDLDLQRRLPELVGARAIADAHDLAAVLHDRVTRWSAATRQDGARLIAGLIPVAHVDDPDTQRALDQRAELIEQRARALVKQALRAGESWIAALGRPPADPPRKVAWLRAARTVAAYRDRYRNDARIPTPQDTAIAMRAEQVVQQLSGNRDVELTLQNPAVGRSGLGL